MAEEKKLKKTNKRRTSSSTSARNTVDKPNTRASKAPATKSELDMEYDALDLSDPNDDQLDGEDALCTKLNRVMLKRSTYIAKKLTQRAEEGSVTGANLVLQLVRRKKQSKKFSSKGLMALVGTLEGDPDALKSAKQKTGKTAGGTS